MGGGYTWGGVCRSADVLAAGDVDDVVMGLPEVRWSDPLDGVGLRTDTGFVLPAGTVTLLLADVEGSVRAWEADGLATGAAVTVLDRLVIDVVGRRGGVRPEQQCEGDAFVAAFPRASDALAAAVDIQRTLQGSAWAEQRLQLRMGLHTGEVELRDAANYVGSAINRCARLRDVGAGGQILISTTTRDLVADRLPEGVTLRDLGSHRLRDLARAERIYQVEHRDLGAVFPPLHGVDEVPNNLPTQLSSFVGRTVEMVEVSVLSRDARLVTLTGTGGCGKTRLAVHAAAEAVERFSDGVWFVDLAPRQRDGVATAALDALNLRVDVAEPPAARLVRALSGATSLVVLDNCEHLIDEAAELADLLLRCCPGVSVLATSRSPLGVEGEVVYRVPSLSLPAEAAGVEALTLCDAVVLFTERARRARPNFVLDDRNAATVASICRRLDGIPLALELAAARTRVLSPARILAGLDDRFRVLGAGPRTALPRQATLAASVGWSHDLLSDAERVVFRRLSVFAGAFDLDAAEAVVPDDEAGRYDVLDVLAGLLDRSLVAPEEGADGERYVLLETLRAYGRARLDDAGEDERVRDRHLAWVVAQAEAAEPHLTGPSQRVALDRLAAIADELEAAAHWAARRDDPVWALRLVAATGLYAVRRGRAFEALPVARGAVARASSATPSFALAPSGQQRFCHSWSAISTARPRSPPMPPSSPSRAETARRWPEPSSSAAG